MWSNNIRTLAGKQCKRGTLRVTLQWVDRGSKWQWRRNIIIVIIHKIKNIKVIYLNSTNTSTLPGPRAPEQEQLLPLLLAILGWGPHLPSLLQFFPPLSTPPPFQPFEAAPLPSRLEGPPLDFPSRFKPSPSRGRRRGDDRRVLCGRGAWGWTQEAPGVDTAVQGLPRAVQRGEQPAWLLQVSHALHQGSGTFFARDRLRGSRFPPRSLIIELSNICTTILHNCL